MENPNSWGPAERVISEAIRQAGLDAWQMTPVNSRKIVDFVRPRA